MNTRFHHDVEHPASTTAHGRPPARFRPRRGMIRASGMFAVLLSLLLCAAGATLAWAVPAGPNITLEVHDHASDGSDGFTNTTASNGAVYSYRYSGGEGAGGDVIFHGRGRVIFHVRLANGSGYAIEHVGFVDDSHQQLRWLARQGSDRHALIQDVNDTIQTARYKITVRVDAGGVTVPCDPIVANRG